MKDEFCILIDKAVDIVKTNMELDINCNYIERYENIIIELENLKKAYLDDKLFRKFFNLNVIHMVEDNIDKQEIILAIDSVNRYYVDNIAEK